MNDQIKLQNLVVPCHVGCTNEERAFPQLLTINITMFLSLKKAAQHDSLNYTVDYAKVAAEIILILKHKPFNLIETVAEEIAAHILGSHDIESVHISIEKRVIPELGAAVVSIWRNR